MGWIQTPVVSLGNSSWNPSVFQHILKNTPFSYENHNFSCPFLKMAISTIKRDPLPSVSAARLEVRHFHAEESPKEAPLAIHGLECPPSRSLRGFCRDSTWALKTVHISLLAIWGVDRLGLDPLPFTSLKSKKVKNKKQKFMSDCGNHQEAVMKQKKLRA